MLPKIISLFLFIFIISGVLAQQADCFRFHEGRFRVADSRAGGVMITERRGDYQTESMEVLKVLLRFKITWINDCSYTLLLDQVLRNENKIPFPNGMVVNVT